MNYAKTNDVMKTLEPLLLKDQDLSALLELNKTASLSLQNLCKDALPSLGGFKACPKKDTYGNKTNYFHQVIARKLFQISTDRTIKIEGEFSKANLLWFACELGLFEALDYQAILLIEQLARMFSEESYKDNRELQQKVDLITEKLQLITQHYFLLHWKAGYVFAAIYQLLLVHVYMLKIEKLQTLADLSLKQEEQETVKLIEVTRLNALKNLLCASWLGSAEVIEKFPRANNLKNKDLLNKFLASPLLTQYATASTDPINLIANQLRFSLKKAKLSSIHMAKEEIKNLKEALKIRSEKC